MSDRLRELQRQRSLAQEQLAWLDREIAAESGLAPAAAPSPPTPGNTTRPGTNPATAAAAAAIIAKYQGDPGDVHGNVKRGCAIYFLLAFVLVGLGVLALYLYTNRK